MTEEVLNNEESKAPEKEEVKNNEESNTQGQQKASQKENDSANYSLNLALFGGLVGAGIGMLLNPEKTKNVLRNISESDLAKTAGKEFRKTTQTLLAAQAQNSLSQLAATNEGASAEESSQSYEELKNENKNLNERLEKIEQMLSELVETK